LHQHNQPDNTRWQGQAERPEAGTQTRRNVAAPNKPSEYKVFGGVQLIVPQNITLVPLPRIFKSYEAILVSGVGTYAIAASRNPSSG
jgi:hypothetical protein